MTIPHNFGFIGPDQMTPHRGSAAGARGVPAPPDDGYFFSSLSNRARSLQVEQCGSY